MGDTTDRAETERLEKLAEAFHEGFRKHVLAPEWSRVSNDWKLAVREGVRAVFKKVG